MQEELRVICPKASRIGLDRLKNIVLRHKMLTDIQKRSKPTIILFREDALDFNYDISQKRAYRFADRLSQMIEGGPWFSVLFTIEQKNGCGIANTSYFIKQGNYRCKAKVMLSRFDEYRMFIHDKEMFRVNHSIWDERMTRHLRSRNGFIEEKIPEGFNIEFRVCSDIFMDPIKKRLDTLTLVSAIGLNEINRRLLKKRAAMVINTDKNNSAGVLKTVKSRVEDRLINDDQLDTEFLISRR